MPIPANREGLSLERWIVRRSGCKNKTWNRGWSPLIRTQCWMRSAAWSQATVRVHIDFSGQKEATALSKPISGDGLSEAQLIVPSQDDLFSSGTLGRYCRVLGDVMESRLVLPNEREDSGGELLSEPRQWNDPGSVRPGS